MNDESGVGDEVMTARKSNLDNNWVTKSKVVANNWFIISQSQRGLAIRQKIELTIELGQL